MSSSSSSHPKPTGVNHLRKNHKEINWMFFIANVLPSVRIEAAMKTQTVTKCLCLKYPPFACID